MWTISFGDATSYSAPLNMMLSRRNTCQVEAVAPAGRRNMTEINEITVEGFSELYPEIADKCDLFTEIYNNYDDSQFNFLAALNLFTIITITPILENLEEKYSVTTLEENPVYSMLSALHRVSSLGLLNYHKANSNG